MFDIFANWGMQNPDERKKSLEEMLEVHNMVQVYKTKVILKISSSLDSKGGYNLRGRQISKC